MKLYDKRGILFIISSPSGGGKTTVTNNLIRFDHNLVRSISATTRSSRMNEVDGVDYFFKTEEEFLSLKQQGELLEHAQVFNHYYGTMKSQVEANLNSGIDVVCCIDYQGAEQIRKKMRNVSIFLLPPSIKILQARLSRRCNDSSRLMNDRLSKAGGEIINYEKYDYVLINNNFEETVNSVRSIIMAERSKPEVQGSLKEFINTLLREHVDIFGK